MKVLNVLFPMALPSLANARMHHMQRASLMRRQRIQAWSELRAAAGGGVKVLKAPITVTLTRVAPRRLDDDNLTGAFKAVRDGVADWLGVDDGDPCLRWVTTQRAGMPRQQAVEVTIEDAR